MEYPLLALVLILAVALAGSPVGLHLLAWRRVETRRVVINLKSGQAVDGYLIRRRGSLLFIRDAQLLEGTGDPVPLDGEVIIDRAEVDFIQAP
jgi:hypothetical protein